MKIVIQTTNDPLLNADIALASYKNLDAYRLYTKFAMGEYRTTVIDLKVLKIILL